MTSAEGFLDTPLCLAWGAASMTLSGEVESGDGYVVRAFHDGVVVAAVDGLGHGDEAAAAARTAIATIESSAHESVLAHFKRCHERLGRTRGAVMSIASFSNEGTLTWAGVGNIEGALLRGDGEGGDPSREHMLVHAGVVGYQMPVLRPSILPLGRGDTLIFGTDGITPGFLNGVTIAKAVEPANALSASNEVRHMADRIIGQHAKGTDDALVVVVRYWGAPG